jgi:hypothetical protein
MWKAGAYPIKLLMDFRNKLQCLSLQVLHCMVGRWPYPQTLDRAEKACQGQTLAYYENL